MNPRIKLLAEQAERLAKDELAHLERVHNRLYSLTEGREIYNEKFAQLIVRECAFVAQNKDSTNIDLRYARGLAAGKILEHFGVQG